MNYDEVELIERARIAFAKAGGTEQPGSSSDVQVVGDVVYVALRNVNGTLAVYAWDGASLVRRDSWPPELDAV